MPAQNEGVPTKESGASKSGDVLYPYSIKTEDTSAGLRVSVHVYGVDPVKAVTDQFDLVQKVKSRYRGAGYLIESDSQVLKAIDAYKRMKEEYPKFSEEMKKDVDSTA